MTEKQIKDIYDRVSNCLENARVHDATVLLRNTAEGAMLYEITDRINDTERNYRYMLRYLADGAEDPGRGRQLADTVTQLHMALDMLVRRLRLRETPTLYFNTLRTLGHQRLTLEQRLAAYRAINPDDIVTQLAAGNRQTASDAEIERAEHDIFNHIWVTFPLSADNQTIIQNTLADNNIPARLKNTIVQAIYLGLCEAFDARRFNLLLKTYANDTLDMPLRLQALANAMIVLYRYRRRLLPASVQDAIQTVRSLDGWANDLRTVFISFAQTRNTERINDTMRNEIIPGMMSLGKDFTDKIAGADLSPENIESNPEWAEKLEKSGLGERLKRLSDMQQKGDDVFMATFAHLKNYPFFNHPANWFVPFDSDNPNLADCPVPEALQVIESLPFICDNDKFTLGLSLRMVPESQRRMLLDQMQKQRDFNADEVAHTLLGDDASADKKAAVGNHMRNTYRFVNLFRRKGEFYDPFADKINLLDVPVLQKDFTDVTLLGVMAEYFFELEYWADAALAFARLDRLEGPDPDILEKSGYALQRLGQMQEAADNYQQALTLRPTSRWTLKRLSETYTALGKHDDAARYLARLAAMQPDDAATAAAYGSALAAQGLYAKAIEQFFRADYLGIDTPGLKRHLAKAQFMDGRHADALKTLDKIDAADAKADDDILHGHILLALKHYRQAITQYATATKRPSMSPQKTVARILKDSAMLAAAGTDAGTLRLVTDALLYETTD